MTRLGNRRFAARRDDSEPEIIEALNKAGWKVWRSLPVDLLLYHPGRNQFRVLEAKSIGKPLKPKPGPQERFVTATGCPIVDNPEDALKALQ